MTQITDEKIMAFVDSESSPEEAAEIETQMKTDAELRARIDEERRLKTSLAGAYADVLDTPVPDRLTDLVRHGPGKAAGGGVISLADRVRRLPTWAAPAAMAASLAAGFLLGVNTMTSSTDIMRFQDGRTIAGRDLADQLEREPSSAVSEATNGMRLVSSFADLTGAPCREFELVAEVATAGVACRAGEQWRVVAIAPRQTPRVVGEAPADAYFPAGGPGDDAIAAVIGQMIDGEALSADAERLMIKLSWTPPPE